jgi:hypothetical protein
MAELSLPDQLHNRDRDRLRRYADHLAFYNGDQWIGHEKRGHRRLTWNYTKSIIHKVTAYLMTGRTVRVDPDDRTDQAIERADQVETALLQVWDDNDAQALDFDTELDAAVLGDGVHKVFWDPDEHRVRLTAPDPAGIFAWHWPDDPSRIWRVANRYQLPKEDLPHTLPKAVDLSSVALQRTNTIIEAWTRETYEMWVNKSRVLNDPNPYGFIPFIPFPNLREPKKLWGESDIPQILDPQRELNRAATQLSRILELSGNPIAVLENVTEAQDIAVQPGAIWELPADAKAYLLDLLQHGGVRLHIDFIDVIFRALHDLGETPRGAFGQTERNISGVALELELDPIVKKVERKRLIRTAAYRGRNDMILALLDRFADTTFGVVNHDIGWGTILPTDRDREVTNEMSMVAAGVHSRRHAADALGEVDDPDAEYARWLEEQRQAQAATGASPPPVRPPR